MQRDAPGHHGPQAEQRREVEHVGADDDARADLLLVLGERGDRRGDLRGVRGQRGHHAEQRLGQADPLADPLQAGDQQVAGGQADGRAEAEGEHLDGYRHWAGFLPRADRAPTSLPGSPGLTLPAGSSRPRPAGYQGLGVELPKTWSCSWVAVTDVPQIPAGSWPLTAVQFAQAISEYCSACGVGVPGVGRDPERALLDPGRAELQVVGRVPGDAEGLRVGAGLVVRLPPGVEVVGVPGVDGDLATANQLRPVPGRSPD